MAKKPENTDEPVTITTTTVTVVGPQAGRYRCGKVDWFFTREPKVVEATDAELKELQADAELVVVIGDTTKPADAKPAA